MAKVYLVCGPCGAGKTTYSQKLASEQKALHFNIDEWMMILFGADSPTPMTFEWAFERTQRCHSQVWKIARQALAHDLNVILDLGFYKRVQREEFLELARQASAPAEIHYLEVPKSIRQDRVRKRNLGSPTKTIEVSDQIFEWAEAWFEPLTDDERSNHVKPLL